MKGRIAMLLGATAAAFGVSPISHSLTSMPMLAAVMPTQAPRPRKSRGGRSVAQDRRQARKRRNVRRFRAAQRG